MGKKCFKAIDLFAGIGGIRLGFEQAFGDQIRTGYACELDKQARRTYEANFKTDRIDTDITKVDEKEIPDFDICLAGFPCQPFSLAGSRMGLQDDHHGICRGTLFLDIARICGYHRPKVIFCENVKGLLNHDKGKTFQVIRTTFEKIGYKVFYDVLNSRDHDIPQNRERLYIICFRNDIAPDHFDLPHGKPTMRRLRDILDPAPIPSKYYLSETYMASLRKHREEQEKNKRGYGYVIRDLDDIAGTLLCGGMGRERNLVIDHRAHSMVPTTRIHGEINKEDVRKLTPSEWRRLQGFPEDFKMPGSDACLYKQLGNTVTVPVIAAIAQAVKEVLVRIEDLEE